AAELALLDTLVHLDAIGAKLRQQRVEVVDTEVDHVRLRARAEVAGVIGERRPQRVARPLFVLVEANAAPFLGNQTEMFRVPRSERGGGAGFEENAAQSGDLGHDSLTCA